MALYTWSAQVSLLTFQRLIDTLEFRMKNRVKLCWVPHPKPTRGISWPLFNLIVTEEGMLAYVLVFVVRRLQFAVNLIMGWIEVRWVKADGIVLQLIQQIAPGETVF